MRSAWMVAHGVARADERVLIEQGMEMKRPSHIFVRASRQDNRVVNVRVGGNAVEILRGEVSFEFRVRHTLENSLLHDRDEIFNSANFPLASAILYIPARSAITMQVALKIS